MEKLLSKEEVELQLRAKSDEISRRIDAIQDEITNTGEQVRQAIFENPLVTVGASVGAGLLVGLIFGGSGSKNKPDTAKRYRSLIDEYIEAIADETKKGAKKGKDAGEAVKGALKDRVPLIVYQGASPKEERGFFADALDLVFKTALGFGVKMAIDYGVARFGLDDVAEALQTSGGSDAFAPIAAIFSEDD